MEERPVQFFDKIKTSKNLPSLPQILLKLIELCNNEESTLKDISQIINKDTRYVSNHIDDKINQAVGDTQGHVEIAIRDDGPGYC